jgi:hypothetical protein
MKTPTLIRSLLHLATGMLFLALASPMARATPTLLQQITLNPGWNAVHVRVQPNTPNLDTLFAGLPIQGVWTYVQGTGSPDFIQEVSEAALSKAGWISWVPASSPDAFQNDLSRLQVNRSYLIHYTGATSTNVVVGGRPALRPAAWLPDAYNLRGLPVDPSFQPTFLDFFRFSAAHYSATGGLQPIYRLNGAGVWTRVAPTDQIAPGTAYWIFTNGSSDYQAPLGLSIPAGDGLDYLDVVDEITLTTSNAAETGAEVTLSDLSSPTNNPLSHAVRLTDGTLTWPILPSPLVFQLPAKDSRNQRIAVRRADMTNELFETVLEIKDGRGSCHYLAVSVIRPVAPASVSSTASPNAKSLGLSTAHAGLWIGTATINAVSEAHSGPLSTNLEQGFTRVLETNAVTRLVTTNLVPNSVVRTNVSMATTPTGSEFRLRVLVHVDQTGRARLLKEVIQMWQNGTVSNAADGTTVALTPGRVVLVTDDTKISQFTGITARDGDVVGRRISSAGFDFAGNELPLSGSFEIGSSVRGTNTMSETFATNPFRHRYHPDNSRGFNLRRVIELELSPPGTNAPPGYGERVLEGSYHETVTGLHRTNIVVAGTLQLSRVSTTSVLNQ